jgi:iron complex transport system substrate-binding protein
MNRQLPFFLLVLLTARGAAAPQPLSVVDARGKRVALRSAPRRIVSLTPANTEILFALGLKGRVVADTAYCDYPPEARSLLHVGDMNISVEKVIAQRPDLVAASRSANRRAVEQLERARIPVFTVDPKNLAETYAAIRAIGQITGQAGKAEAVIRQMRSRVAAVRAAVAKDPAKPRVLIILQADPLWVAGSGNFLDELVTLAGGVNVARDAGTGYHTLSPERVALLKPDVIIVPKEDAARVRSRAGWGSLPAVQRNAVYSPDPDLMNRPGPRLAQGLEEIARLLHPGRFQRPR